MVDTKETNLACSISIEHHRCCTQLLNRSEASVQWDSRVAYIYSYSKAVNYLVETYPTAHVFVKVDPDLTIWWDFPNFKNDHQQNMMWVYWTRSYNMTDYIANMYCKASSLMELYNSYATASVHNWSLWKQEITGFDTSCDTVEVFKTTSGQYWCTLSPWEMKYPHGNTACRVGSWNIV